MSGRYLHIPMTLIADVRGALEKAGNIEVGGHLWGKFISEEALMVTDISIQRGGGNAYNFYVDILQTEDFAKEFFEKTRHQYERFNYIGEWHSHPNYELTPSDIDISEMRKLVMDEDFSGHFAVLLIAKLVCEDVGECTNVFFRCGHMAPVEVVFIDE